MKNFLFITTFLFSFSALAELVVFNAGITHESCTKEGVDRVCDLFPLNMNQVELEFVDSDYAFSEVRHEDKDTGAQFSAHFSAVRYLEEGFYDLYIAFKGRGENEGWVYQKIRLRNFRNLNHFVTTGIMIKVKARELTAKLFVAPIN